MKYSRLCFAVIFIPLSFSGYNAFPAEDLRVTSVDAMKLLPAPPAAGSVETQEELKLLRRLQKHRTPEEIERCKAESELDMSAFQPVFGPWFTAENLPEMHKLFKQVHTESKTISDSAKKHFNRPRPHKADSRINPTLDKDKEDEPSYPSGHATRGILYALILCEIAPEKKEALLERGREIGWDRVIAGVHYPSDVAAGRTLGQAIMQSLLTDPIFRERLEKVKLEFEEFQKQKAIYNTPPINATFVHCYLPDHLRFQVSQFSCGLWDWRIPRNTNAKL
jgi:acid phosphatase (class A)